MSKPSVLFVCLGNICRSPAAEGVLRGVMDKRGLAGRIEVDSAGTTAYHTGERADRRMRDAASQRGYALESRARQVTRADFERFDLVIAMDQSNFDDLRQLAHGSEHVDRLRLFSDFLPAGAPRDVPDPYYGGDEGFEQVLDMAEQGAHAILERLAGDGV